MGAIGFHVDTIACKSGLNQLSGDLQSGFAPREADAATGVLRYGLAYVVDCHQLEGVVLGVAKGTLEIAARKAHKHHGHTCISALALERIEDFVDAVGLFHGIIVHKWLYFR